MNGWCQEVLPGVVFVQVIHAMVYIEERLQDSASRAESRLIMGEVSLRPRPCPRREVISKLIYSA